VLAWLARYIDSPATLASYRKEAERLMLWCAQQRSPLSDLTHEDFLAYQRFLSDPQPAERWMMVPGRKPARSSPAWRPFAGPLSPVSQRQAMSILNAMLSWLVEAGYLAGNPLALSRRKRIAAPPRVTRFLPQEHWQAVKTTVEAIPTTSARKAAHAARSRWLFSLLYIGALRISEICVATMGGFFARPSANGTARWWLEATGKGGKTQLVPATDELMAELIRYRRANGLSALPAQGDEMPLLLPLIGPPKPMARSAIHEIVKDVMSAPAQRLRTQGAGFDGAAAHIEQASAHWLRHTAGSYLSEHVDLKVVRDNLGHANIGTTSLYLHTEDDARHDATQQAHRLRWQTL
jgi:site-specific recombinase XerD